MTYNVFSGTLNLAQSIYRCAFLNVRLNLPALAPRQKCKPIRGWVPGWTWQTHSGIPLNHPVVYTVGGWKNPKFCLDFRPQSPLRRCGFETRHHISEL